MLKETNANIPELSPGEAVKILSEFYCSAITRRKPFNKLPAVFLWGPFGIGKSDGVRQIAREIENRTGKRVSITDVRLLMFSPIDLRGVPIASGKDGLSYWLKPKIFDMDASDDVVNILFLDELSAAPQSVQAAAYQITLDRVIGEHRLPDNCIVIAAGNRTTDKSVSYVMPKALCNRLLHFSICSEVDSWLEWAVHNHIDKRIIGFISFDNSRLNVCPDTSDMAFSTPRSWTYVSEILDVMPTDNLSDVYPLIASAVGKDTAVAFERYCELYESLPDVKSIFNGTCRVFPKSHDVLYALISSIVEALNEKPDVSESVLENICLYASHFPADFAMTLFTDMSRIEGIRAKLAKTRVFQQWLAKNGRTL